MLIGLTPCCSPAPPRNPRTPLLEAPVVAGEASPVAAEASPMATEAPVVAAEAPVVAGSRLARTGTPLPQRALTMLERVDWAPLPAALRACTVKR
ncbi:hypothetical protein GCM10027425_10630 [Alteromonas gracilis]